jgi:hypothetical protein
VKPSFGKDPTPRNIRGQAKYGSSGRGQNNIGEPKENLTLPMLTNKNQASTYTSNKQPKYNLLNGTDAQVNNLNARTKQKGGLQMK